MANLTFDLALSDESINKDWQFKDLSIDIRTTKDGKDIEVSKDISAIQNGITNMFMFIQGERILNPDFGNSIYKYIYEPITDVVASKIKHEIELMFNMWEPRVTITYINVIPDEDHNTFNIEVIYEIPSLSVGGLSYKTALESRRENY